jgi:hypothetical protein
MVKLQKWWHPLRHGSANEIAFSWAVRSICATALPLLIMPFFGLEQASRLLAIGALNTSMVDAGGTYRNRLIAMGLNAVLSPISMLLGAEARDPWPLATVLMLMIALASGMARALGPSVTPLGLFVGLSFLIGTNLPPGLEVSVEAALLYSAGAFWTMFIAWRSGGYVRSSGSNRKWPRFGRACRPLLRPQAGQGNLARLAGASVCSRSAISQSVMPWSGHEMPWATFENRCPDPVLRWLSCLRSCEQRRVLRRRFSASRNCDTIKTDTAKILLRPQR